MSMPWYITLGLFVLGPLYAMLIRDILWRRIQGWWANRSISNSQERITRLKADLERYRDVVPLSLFEDEILFIFQYGGLTTTSIVLTLFYLSHMAKPSDWLTKTQLVGCFAASQIWYFLLGHATGLRDRLSPVKHRNKVMELERLEFRLSQASRQADKQA
jgi:hypothetical protein